MKAIALPVGTHTHATIEADFAFIHTFHLFYGSPSLSLTLNYQSQHQQYNQKPISGIISHDVHTPELLFLQ